MNLLNFFLFLFLGLDVFQCVVLSCNKFRKTTTKQIGAQCVVKEVVVVSTLSCARSCTLAGNVCRLFDFNSVERTCRLGACDEAITTTSTGRVVYEAQGCDKEFSLVESIVQSKAEAARQCATVDGELAEPRNIREFNTIIQLVNGSETCRNGTDSRAFYIGLKNPSGSTVTDSDGAPLTYDAEVFWDKVQGQPNDEIEREIIIYCDGIRVEMWDHNDPARMAQLYTVCERLDEYQ